MTILTKLILATFTFAFAANINAQTQTVILGELSQLKFNISNVANTNKCHIEVTLPNQQKVGVEVDGPQFIASVEFTPQQVGSSVIQWEGKNKLRGLKSVFGCPGSGVIEVQVNGNTEQIAQKWNQYFSAVNEEIKDCVKVGMDLSQLKYQVLADPAVTLTSPQDPKLKPIYEKCEIFAKQNQPRKGVQCTLPSQNNLKTTCDGVYAERQPDGRLKTISRTAAIQLQFEGKPWTVGVLENLDVRSARLKQEGDDKAKQADELAAKKEADEKERLFKLSPEYKKQQAALEIKRIADEKEAARKQAEQEKIRIAEERQAAINNTKKDLEEKAAIAQLKKLWIGHWDPTPLGCVEGTGVFVENGKDGNLNSRFMAKDPSGKIFQHSKAENKKFKLVGVSSLSFDRDTTFFNGEKKLTSENEIEINSNQYFFKVPNAVIYLNCSDPNIKNQAAQAKKIKIEQEKDIVAERGRFDKTGIIDIKNEGATRGSCAAVGGRLKLATNQLWSKIISRPAQGQDEQWKNQKDAEAMNKFGDNGSYWSKELNDGMSKHVPPSQMKDYFDAFSAASNRFDRAIEKDPWKGVDAWNYCGNAYGLFKK